MSGLCQEISLYPKPINIWNAVNFHDFFISYNFCSIKLWNIKFVNLPRSSATIRIIFGGLDALHTLQNIADQKITLKGTLLVSGDILE